MKAILLAAAALVAVPAIAQTTTSGTGSPAGADMQGQPTTTADPAQTPPAADPAMGDPAAADPSTAAPQGQMAPDASAPMQGQTTGSTQGTAAPADPNAPTPAGGYQPSQPPMAGPAQPGATVRFQAAPSPDQAYPAPAPLQSYPVCKRGQYDKCRNPGGK